MDEKTKKELQELYAFFLPHDRLDYSELEKLFQRIDSEPTIIQR